MEQQPVRRRRRRRRSSKVQRETVAWLTFLIGIVKRSYHWVVLLAILGVILIIGLGLPIRQLDPIITLLTILGYR